MANLYAIIKELQQERDRLDAAIEALTSLSGNTVKDPARGAACQLQPTGLLQRKERD